MEVSPAMKAMQWSKLGCRSTDSSSSSSGGHCTYNSENVGSSTSSSVSGAGGSMDTIGGVGEREAGCSNSGGGKGREASDARPAGIILPSSVGPIGSTSSSRGGVSGRGEGAGLSPQGSLSPSSSSAAAAAAAAVGQPGGRSQFNDVQVRVPVSVFLLLLLLS